MEYAFHVYNKLSIDGLSTAVDHLLRADLEKKLTPRALLEDKSAYTPNRAFLRKFDGNLHKPPVVVCIGSDLAIGDSLGPIVGSLLQQKTRSLPVFIYGTLSCPITAKEIKYLRTLLKETHAGSQIIAVDAAVGLGEDVGLIKAIDCPLSPGAGANKKLGTIGDLSIMGIVAERSTLNYALLNTTRLNLVYSMAERIADALSNLIYNRYDLCKLQAEND